MVATVQPNLPELAQRLAKKESELEAARQAYEARLADLTRQKEKLQSQLRTVESEIQAVSSKAAGGAPPVATSKPSPRQGKAEGAPTLLGLLVGLVRAAGRPLTVKELADEVVRAKFPTTSGNIPKMVKNKVGELVKRGRLRRAEGQPGVVLGKSQAGKQAQAAKVGSNGKAVPKPAAPAKPAKDQAKLPLGELVLRLLAKSSRPLKARELAQKALAAGYQTNSKDFTNVIWVALGKLNDVESVPGQGYRLKKRSAKAK